MPSSAEIIGWALPRIRQVLPLDDESLTQVLEYSLTLSTEEAASHLQNILGDSPDTLDFIAGFNGLCTRGASAGAGSRGQVKTASPATGAPGRGKKETSRSHGTAAEAGSSSRRSDTGGRQDPASAGRFISEFLPNVKSKAARQPQGKDVGGAGSGSPGSSSRAKHTSSKVVAKTNDLTDLTSAIAALEITTNPSLAKAQERRKCDCAATIHPLFTTAPNCLNCGKIICAYEGLQPCSFCGKPLLSSSEVQDMIRELRNERGNEKMRINNEAQQKHTTAGGATASPTSSLAAARAHRDKLLSFQEQNAQRTTIVDEAADFETPSSGATQWMTPAQRALALKRQQRVLRELEEQAKPEWERKKMVMSLDVKSGKVIRMVERGQSGTADDEEARKAREEERALEKQAEAEAAEADRRASQAGGSLSHNPLLASGGLTRPIWEPTGKGKRSDAQPRQHKQTWSRVQEDYIGAASSTPV
ncbi:hypothetical protein KEM52_006530 [Ascosphaera acerosa]|nr:hypothetical protein KEM52_006530 [Ascosphaera acerosa]